MMELLFLRPPHLYLALGLSRLDETLLAGVGSEVADPTLKFS